jgi:hypothetical protein
VRLDDGVWVQEEMWYRVSMRVGLVRTYNTESGTIYSDYRLASTDPRLAAAR